MGKIPIALQLFSVRDDCARDLSGTLKAVAKMGYEGVEFAGYYNRTADELKKMVDDLGLKVAGTHTGLNTLLGDELEKTIEFNKTLGNKFLIVPWIPEEKRNSKQAWLETAKFFNEVAKKVKRRGMRVGYHNHHMEFMPIDGEMPWDIFGGATSPEVVMQIDTGNALHGKISVNRLIATVKRYPGRSVTVHLKEFSATNDKAVIGEGDMKWKQFFKLCETVGGTKWYIVEQESYAYPPIECVKLCVNNLRKMT
jgi:sugar phosphate isomerase/epimerase